MPIPPVTVARPKREPRRPTRPFRSGVCALAVALVTALGLSLGTASPAQAADHIIIGASGDANGLESHVGTRIARHVYGKLSGPARVAELVNIETTVSWSQVANGSQDANIKRWAAALKGKDVMVSFSHEPMAKQNRHFGDASSFIGAWKRMRSVFAAQGSTSVKWVWNVTSHSFRVPTSDSGYGAKWYPGDSLVDYVAGEVYNRAGCGQAEASFESKLREIFAFANQHHKRFVTAEFASNSYPGRAAWIRNAQAWMAAHQSQIVGAFYWNPPTAVCHFHLETSAEFSAFRSLVSSPGFGA